MQLFSIMSCGKCIVYVASLYSHWLLTCVMGLKNNMSSFNDESARSEAWIGWLVSQLESCWYSVLKTMTLLYSVYLKLTWYHMLLFVLKYIPTGIYSFKMLRSVYNKSRDKIVQKRIELDDIHLQIQIVETKLMVREAEWSERTAALVARAAERRRAVRARVLALIDADDALRCSLRRAADGDHEDPVKWFAVDEERDIILALLNELNGDEQYMDMKDFGCSEQPATNEQTNADASVYTSLSDVDSKQESQIKIVKVTNVYKVTCLRNFIKQKRMRRATQQAILKKKIEGIKKLLESWHKSLNAVICNKICLDPLNDMMSQEATADYSRQNLREFSDSDSELKTSCTDVCYDEYNNWSQNNYFGMETLKAVEPKQVFQSSEFHKHQPRCDCHEAGMLFILPEETSSQVAIEEVDQCRDVIPI